MIIVTTSFSKSSVFKTFSVHMKRKASVFKFLCFEERLRKARFCGDKAAFSNSSSGRSVDGS